MTTENATNKMPGSRLISACFLILLFIVTLVYANSFHNSFHFDDSHTIENNLYIRNIHNIPRFFTDGTTFSSLPSNQSYRPVVTMLNAIDYHLAGKALPNPFVFHISIFISFLLLGMCIYFFVVRILNITGPNAVNRWIALFITAWFWLHAANAETINYIIARTDSFSTFMVLLAFVLYLYSPVAKKYYLYMLPVAVGFLAKEPAVLFVPLLFFYKLFFEYDLSIPAALKKIKVTAGILRPLVVPIVIVVVLFIWYKQMTPATWQTGGVNRIGYLLAQPFVIFHYFMNFIIPANLVADTDWTVITSFTDDRVFTGLLFIIALVVIAVITSRKAAYRPVAFGIIWFFIALAPTSLIPFAEVLNDHRTFFPFIGLFIACAALLRNLVNSYPTLLQKTSARFATIFIIVIFLGCHAMATYHRNEVWHTEASLWKEVTVKSPNDGRGWMNYGLSQMAIGNFGVAEECYKKAMAIWPSYAYIYINMGVLKSATGAADAEQYFRKALALDPNSPECYAYYAAYLIKCHRNSEAAALLQKGLAISPGHQMMNELVKENATAKSPMQQAQYDVTTHPTAENYLQLSLEYYNEGRYQKCIDAATQSLQIKPDYDLAYNNICAAYNQLHIWDKAIAAGEKGLKLNPANAQLKANLQVSYKKGK